jgi:hypothetical protein
MSRPPPSPEAADFDKGSETGILPVERTGGSFSVLWVSCFWVFGDSLALAQPKRLVGTEQEQVWVSIRGKKIVVKDDPRPHDKKSLWKCEEQSWMFYTQVPIPYTPAETLV